MKFLLTQFFITVTLGLSSASAFGETTRCSWVYGKQTGIGKIEIDWHSPSAGTIYLSARNGLSNTFEAYFQSGSEISTKCGRYSWKSARFGENGRFTLYLKQGGCTSYNDQGREIKLSALFSIVESDDIKRDEFSCNNF